MEAEINELSEWGQRQPAFLAVEEEEEKNQDSFPYSPQMIIYFT